MKQRVIDAIEKLGHTVIDRGTDSTDPVDFPDITQATCAPVLDGSADRAVLVCGTGAGAIMAANKIPGIRCGLANETYSAHQAVEHDDGVVQLSGCDRYASDLAENLIAGLHPGTVASGRNRSQPHASDC